LNQDEPMQILASAARRLGLAASTALLLSGCASYDRGIAWLQYHQVPELSDDQTDLVDGTYKGLVSVEQSNGPGCPERREGTLEIGDHSLFFAYTPSIFFITFVQPDGTLSGHAGDATLDGKVEDGFLHFVVTSPDCRISYAFRYVV